MHAVCVLIIETHIVNESIRQNFSRRNAKTAKKSFNMSEMADLLEGSALANVSQSLTARP
jgi:hypothetical protein